MATAANGAVILFEDLDGSTVSGNATSTAVVVGGENVGEFVINGTTGFSSLGSGDIAVPMSLIGEQVTFSVDLLGDANLVGTSASDPDDAVFIQLNFNGTNSGSAGFGPTSSVTTLSFTAVIPAGTTTVSGQLQVVDGGFPANPDGVAGSVLQFDNFRIEAVPEPSSALLAGLGCLTLVRRRRS